MNMNLAEQYMPLADSIACRISRNTPADITLDDLKSAAYYALTLAASRYDPSVGVSFATYSRSRIVGEVMDCMRRRRAAHSEIVDVAANPAADTVETEDFFDFVCSELGSEDGKSLRMYYVEGRSLREVGDSRNVSESRACQILKDCHSRIRRSMRRSWS